MGSARPLRVGRRQDYYSNIEMDSVTESERMRRFQVRVEMSNRIKINQS